MKKLIKWMLYLIAIVVALTTNGYGYLSDGVINIIVLVSWVQITLISLGGLSIFDDKRLAQMASQLKEHGIKAWHSKLRVSIFASIGCSFVYWGYWVTGLGWIFAALVASVLLYVVHVFEKALDAGEQ
ncbi:hypothetical protein LQK33_000481 [Vibrio vulnificus]|nr:hypothetical protein [Vibrio vulnificus]